MKKVVILSGAGIRAESIIHIKDKASTGVARAIAMLEP